MEIKVKRFKLDWNNDVHKKMYMDNIEAAFEDQSLEHRIEGISRHLSEEDIER